MKPTKTWVLIADGARARVLQNDGPGHGLHAVEGHEFHSDHSATHDLVSDREGRSFSSHGRRSTIESHSDPHRELKKKFTHQLADILARGLEQHAYDRLVSKRVCGRDILRSGRLVQPARNCAAAQRLDGRLARNGCEQVRQSCFVDARNTLIKQL
jgi:protein required for attachment to host cells